MSHSGAVPILEKHGSVPGKRPAVDGDSARRNAAGAAADSVSELAAVGSVSAGSEPSSFPSCLPSVFLPTFQAATFLSLSHISYPGQ
jgi:hypothetical protein